MGLWIRLSLAAAISSCVFSVVVQPDGAVLIGGEFASIGGVSRNGVARLNANGSLDAFFDAGSGIDGAGICCGVRALALQPDGRVIVGGFFLNHKWNCAQQRSEVERRWQPGRYFYSPARTER